MSARGWVIGRRALGWLALAVLPACFLTVFFAVPVLGMLRLGLLPEGSLDLTGVLEVLTRRRTLEVAWFTLWSSTVATAFALALGVPMAALLYRRHFVGRGAIRALVAVPFVLPTVVVGVAFRTLLADSGVLGGLGWDGTPQRSSPLWCSSTSQWWSALSVSVGVNSTRVRPRPLLRWELPLSRCCGPSPCPHFAQRWPRLQASFSSSVQRLSVWC